VACGGGYVRKNTKEVAEDRVHGLNYERHQKVTSIFPLQIKTSTKFNCGGFHM
jgi:hypothetical protein